jgi:hypothetical protein
MPKAVKPYEVQWGTSGGFTGGGEGYILYTDGRLAQWKKRTAASPIETREIGRATLETAAEIGRIIDENKLLQFKHVRPGNMTTSVIIRSKGREHAISWSAESVKPPMEVAPLMERLQALVVKMKK